jgi:hypothetical protein
MAHNLLRFDKTPKTFFGKAWYWNHGYLEKLGIRSRINLAPEAARLWRYRRAQPLRASSMNSAGNAAISSTT